MHRRVSYFNFCIPQHLLPPLLLPTDCLLSAFICGGYYGITNRSRRIIYQPASIWVNSRRGLSLELAGKEIGSGCYQLADGNINGERFLLYRGIVMIIRTVGVS